MATTSTITMTTICSDYGCNNDDGDNDSVVTISEDEVKDNNDTSNNVMPSFLAFVFEKNVSSTDFPSRLNDHAHLDFVGAGQVSPTDPSSTPADRFSLRAVLYDGQHLANGATLPCVRRPGSRGPEVPEGYVDSLAPRRNDLPRGVEATTPGLLGYVVR